MNYRSLRKWRVESRQRLAELRAFAQQYSEWVSALESITVMSAIELDGMPKGSGVGDPTGEMASERDTYITKIKMVDYCIKYCSDDDNVRKAVFKSVTTPGRLSYQNLRARGYTYSRNAFYEAVHKFYWMLDKVKIF